MAPQWAMVVHGGAGVIERAHLKPEQEAAYRAALTAVTQAGSEVLKAGGTALDACETAVRLLEDDPLFNAGRGAVFAAQGRNELDAAVMDGATLAAGAVAGVTRARHPVSLARAVMEHSGHVMLIGQGADDFAAHQGLELAKASHFHTARRWRSLTNFLRAEGLPVPPEPVGPETPDPALGLAHDEGKHGTVGAVALDLHGNVAAATSTGGTTGKRWGRVGDSPLIGAGTYASNAGCAVSATGTGEDFIRLTVARDISALVELKGLSLQSAVDEVVQNRLTAFGGDGGVIAVAPDGQVAWSFNTSGMYRSKVCARQSPVTSIYKDEP